jgi:uncharacterized protein YbjT (DUF2867 family)
MLVVTGPTGNVGAELVQLLVDRKGQIPFRVAAHNPATLHQKYGTDVEAVQFDYDDRTTWPAVLEGIQTLFLLFPLPHPRTVQTRMKPLIDAAVQAGCKHIVYISVPGADRYKVVPHYQVERHIEASGANFTFLRSSFFMQNLYRRISTHGIDIAENNEIFIPAGRGRTSFIDSRDVAAVAFDAVLHPDVHANQAYVLSGAERLNYIEVAQQFTEIFGRPIRYSNPSYLQFWLRMRERRVPGDVIVFMTIVYTLTRLGRNEPLTDTLPRLLKRPPTSVRQFIQNNLWRWETRNWS